MRLPKILLSLAAAALAVPAGAQAATPGVNVVGPAPQALAQALGTGAKTVRMFVRWTDFEPQARGQYPANPQHNAAVDAAILEYDTAIRTLNAAGAKPLFVVTGAPSWANGSNDATVAPSDPEDLAAFLGRFAAHNKAVGSVLGYEVWNEPDENLFWHPAPDAAKYAALLKASYAAIKAADPSATVATGPMTGNDYAWLDQLYAQGAGGSFDVVSVHTDTACSVNGPDFFYREDGRIARYAFLGYRSVHDVMAAHGDGGKPIWMSELGWTTTGGVPSSCQRGMWAGQKASGVTEGDQAAFLTHAYACLANDPYVTQAAWFTLQDDATQSTDELRHYGLLRGDGSAKPSLDAFKAVVAAGGGPAGACGDFDAPRLRVIKPVANQQFVDRLDIQAAAEDGPGGVGLSRIGFTYDGGQKLANFAENLGWDKPVGLTPWYGSSDLALGPHTIEILAIDKNGNAVTQTIPVVKVATLKATLKPTFKLHRFKVHHKRQVVRCHHRVCRLRGMLLRGASAAAGAAPTIGGHVWVQWQYRNNHHKYRRLSGALALASKPFAFRADLKRAGRWRVRVVYQGQAPWKTAKTKFTYFRLK
ncbi:MAG TPA: cellulase family glycosylhydrolase [Baekduia sp.]|nr:cellulase family glycosylhydrolase [Baekduia sp.]